MPSVQSCWTDGIRAKAETVFPKTGNPKNKSRIRGAFFEPEKVTA
jgi:hypothetical protein